jgi:hypothetical protein
MDEQTQYAVLEQHSQKFGDHVTRELRKRNM